MRFLAPFLLSLALIFSSSEVLLSQEKFEGTIEFTQTKNGKPSYWVYYVKGSMVRVEQMGKDKLIQSVMLVDTKKKTITVLDSKRKNYVEIDAMESVKDMTNTRVTMTKEKRKIMGYDCKKWVVVNADIGSSITYWVAPGNFDFFVDFLGTVKRKDNIALFYQQVPAAVGFFPVIGEEKKIDGSIPMRLEATKITKKAMKDSLFQIPVGYSKLEN